MVKIAKESDRGFIKDTPITSSKLLEEPLRIKQGEFKPYKRPRKAKKVISFIEMVKNEVARIFKNNMLFTSVL